MTLFNNSKCFNLESQELSKNKNQINIYFLNYNILSEDELNQWAISIRNNYAPDGLLKYLIDPSISKQKFFQNYKLPDYTSSPGKMTFSGEFGEILFYDYITFVLDYDSPRCRYLYKDNKDVAVNGTDVIGYKMNDTQHPCANDTLLIAEVKTRASAKNHNHYNDTIKKAINDSKKDRKRIAESLNAEKTKLVHAHKMDDAKIITRFQNKIDTPYTTTYKAVAVLNKKANLDKNKIQSIMEELHADSYDTDLIVIYSENLLDLFKDLHRRACNC